MTAPAGPTGARSASAHEVAERRLALALARAEAGLPVAPGDVPAGSARRAVALAVQLGAPLAPTLRAAAATATEARERREAVRRAAAEGRSVATGLVLAPPVLGPLAALLVSDAPLAFYATAPGRAVLTLAGGLWVLGVLVVRALLRSAGRVRGAADGTVDAELLELVVVGLGAGLTVAAAVRAAATARWPEEPAPGASAGRRSAQAVALWLELGAVGAPPAGWGAHGLTLRDGARDGIALGPVVAGLAGGERATEHQEAMERAARLSVRLAVPTALLLLPAGLLVVVAPVVAGALALVR